MSDQAIISRIKDLTFLKSLVSPIDYDSAVPNFDQQTGVRAEVTVLGTFTAKATPAVPPAGINANNMIDTTTGLFTWHPQYDVGRVVRWSRFDKGSHWTPNGGGTLNGNGINRIDFEQATWLLHSQESQPTVSPNLAKEFTLVRATQGVLSLMSATRSGATVDLAGQLHIGSWADSRDGWQTSEGSVTPTQLAELSVNKKDAAIGIDPDEGVFAVLGSDIASAYTFADRSLYKNVNGISPNVLTYPHPTIPIEVSLDGNLFGVANRNQGVGFVGAGRVGVAMQTVWLSPWDTTVQLDTASITSPAYGLNGGPYQFNQKLPNIGCFGSVSFAFGIRCEIDPLSDVLYDAASVNGATNWGGLHFQLLVDDVYASVVPTSTGGYHFVDMSAMDYQYGPIYASNVSAGALGNGAKVFNHTPIARSTTGQFYIGTHVTVQVVGDIQSAKQLVLNSNSFLAIIPTVNIEIGDGSLGPLRLMQYERVSDGQQFTVKGKLFYECITGGNLAPYVRPSAQMASQSESLDWLPITSLLFNGPSRYWKRCYAGDAYRNLVDVYLPRLTIMDFKGPNASEHAAGDSRVPAAMEASGFFDSIGKAFTNLAERAPSIISGATNVAGHMLGLPSGVSSTIGRMAGQGTQGLVNALSSAGEYYSGGTNPQQYQGGLFGARTPLMQLTAGPSARGEYPEARGEYPSARGEYPESAGYYSHRKRHRYG